MLRGCARVVVAPAVVVAQLRRQLWWLQLWWGPAVKVALCCHWSLPARCGALRGQEVRVPGSVSVTLSQGPKCCGGVPAAVVALAVEVAQLRLQLWWLQLWWGPVVVGEVQGRSC